MFISRFSRAQTGADRQARPISLPNQALVMRTQGLSDDLDITPTTIKSRGSNWGWRLMAANLPEAPFCSTRAGPSNCR